jgi:hypothetical protein
MQTAAKCAERQGVSAFESFHQRLFMGHFHDNRDISRQAVLWRLAHDGRLDVPLTPDPALPPRVGGLGRGADDVLLTWLSTSRITTLTVQSIALKHDISNTFSDV